VGDKLIDPLFFRIRIQSMSGLRATDEKERRGQLLMTRHPATKC
jgi:hypothetical protein